MLRKKEHIYIYFFYLAVLLITWGGMLRNSFNADTIYHMVSADHDVLSRIECGRYLCGLIDWLLGLVGLSTTTHTGVTALLAIMIMAFSLLGIHNLYVQFISFQAIWEKAGYMLIIALTFVNVLTAELFMFGEFSFYFAMAYFLAVLGAGAFVRKQYIRAAVWIACSCMFYQTGVAFCAILISAYIYFAHKGRINKKAILSELLCVIMTFGIGFLNMISVQLLVRLGVAEAFGKSSASMRIWENLSDLWRHYISLLQSSKGLLPEVWLPLLYTAVIFLLFVYRQYKMKERQSVLYFLLLYLGMSLLMYGIPLVQPNFSAQPRMVVMFYLIQVLITLILFSAADHQIKRGIVYLAAGYLLIQVLFCHFIIADHFVSNKLDILYVNLMYEEVLRYEEETGITVDKLVVIKDVDAPFSYAEVSYKTDQINERALGQVTHSLVRVVTGRKFEKTQMDPVIYEQYFERKNWDYFYLSEQLIIEEDTAYWIIF